ncbi:MAG TPA: MFS transporter [Candidatus Polarisedimenticolia bacterium]|nr:MFS transporter [Candidatus Polarisedimenticolia bacterium]
MTSWRTASVALIAFSSGLPLGIVWIAIPDWMRNAGVDIRVVGLITLAQAPWTFKFLWSPLMDRYSLPWLGRRRGWMALAQIALFAGMLGLAGVGHHPEAPWVVGALAFALAFASATQDIAYDAYTVDVLRPEEQGVAVGAKNFFYWVAFRGVAGLSIAAAGRFSWPVVNVALAILFLPMLAITWKAPEPPDVPLAPRTVREAVWLPFLGFLSRHRALEILAFVFFYKFADNLAVALTRPFLIDMGYTDFDRGVGVTLVGLVASVAGTMLGGLLTSVIGLGHSLWLFGALQIFSNIGYVFVARSEINHPLMYAATGFDSLATGLGSGAFLVLLLRLTQKRFSATQYALFSSLFGLPRVLAGPVTGFLVDAMGWEAFFWSTLIAGIPGMTLLHRFAPLGQREPSFEVHTARRREPLSRAALFVRGAAGSVGGLVVGVLCVASLAALRAMRKTPEVGFDLPGRLAALASPGGIGDWLQLSGIVVFAAFVGLMTAAVFAARSGVGAEP